jgi:hypothetical protein
MLYWAGVCYASAWLLYYSFTHVYLSIVAD